MSRPIDGLSSIIDDFDLFLIDQYGVLHDGIKAYPYAVNALVELKRRNKQVVVISNSGKRSSVNISRMAKLGFDDELFDHFVSSGEVAYRFLKSYLKDERMNSCFLIARDRDRSAVEGLEIQLSARPENADLILISGCEPERYSEEHYTALLRSSAENKTSCVCTNPDKKMLTSQGLMFGAGRIAECYEALGGMVRWIGKPYPSIYQYILALYGDQKAERVLCIGDSIEHDIAGGSSVKLKTLLVKTGIAADVDSTTLEIYCRRYQVEPDFILPQLVY